MMPAPAIINLLPIAKGGGLQNAMSFLRVLATDSIRRNVSTVICRDGSPAADFIRENLPKRIIVASGLCGRITGEFRDLYSQPEATVCFTLFGAPSLGSRARFVNVCGNAYSNLFHPEVNFWGHLPLRARVKAALIDSYRKHTQRRGDFWVFETEALKQRAIAAGFPEERCAVIRMAPSELIGKDRIDLRQRDAFDSAIPPVFRMLLLAGAHPNKMQQALPELIENLKLAGCRDFCFVTTMDERSNYAQNVITSANSSGNQRHLCNLGPVQPQDCASLISVCDAMLCVSRLESFSNNFLEAWIMEKPLVASDWDWARDAAGDAALYIDLSRKRDSADALRNLIEGHSLRSALIEAGRSRLGQYNTPDSKYIEQWKAVEQARALGPCSAALRKGIRW